MEVISFKICFMSSSKFSSVKNQGFCRVSRNLEKGFRFGSVSTQQDVRHHSTLHEPSKVQQKEVAPRQVLDEDDASASCTGVVAFRGGSHDCSSKCMSGMSDRFRRC